MQLSCSWFLKRGKNDSGFNGHDKLLHSKQRLGALSTTLPSSVYIQFVQFWPLLSFAPAGITMQWQWDKHQSRDKNSQHTFMLPRPLSEPILCEVNHGWYFDTLKLFAIQAVQFATEIHYSDSSLFGSVSFSFGHKQMFCWTPDTPASGDHLEQLWDPGGLASYICSTGALTSLMHYLFAVWLAYATPICIQLGMEKPMASDELNQGMTIHFLPGTLELECRLDKLIAI